MISYSKRMPPSATYEELPKCTDPLSNDFARSDKNFSVKFDPSAHLSFSENPKTTTMADLGYPKNTGISPIAVSEPFKLFSEEAVQQMRREIFQPEVMKNCRYSSNIAACQLRGYAEKYAPFIYDAWHNQTTLAIVSKIAGIDLVPAVEVDIGHINVSVKSDEDVNKEQKLINEQQGQFEDKWGIGDCSWKDKNPIVGWHTDSYPFVCVVMLSDCTNMVGGETALRTAAGEILKVRGPEMGCGVILQGRYITHQALRALGAQERITMVTSFRPRDPMIPDDTVLTTVRPVSNLSDLYYEYADYRLEILEERIRQKRKQLHAQRRAGKGFQTSANKTFLKTQERFLAHTDQEVVDDAEVIPGLQPIVT